MHRLWSVVYKVEYFVLGTLLSSFVSLNTRVIFYFITWTSVITSLAKWAWFISSIFRLAREIGIFWMPYRHYCNLVLNIQLQASSELDYDGSQINIASFQD